MWSISFRKAFFSLFLLVRAFANYVEYDWNLFGQVLNNAQALFSSLGCYDCIPKEVS